MRVMVFIVAMLMVAGCVSTPEKRISRKPEVFASFPPEVQAKVRAGEVAIGFTPEMVRMALGDPNRIHSRITAAGETELWTYTGIASDSSLQPVDSSYVYRDRHGHLHRAYDTRWVEMRHTREYPVLRLEFEAGRVKFIEKAK